MSHLEGFSVASMTVAKKAAAPKATAKKAVAKPRVVAEKPKMTVVAAKKAIVVEGRSIEVKLPTAEQLMAWEATLSTISKMQSSVVEYEKIRAQVDRFYRIASGLFVHQADKDWLEEARLDGVVSIEKDSVLGMITNVIELYKDDMPGAPANRAQKRAAARKKA